MEKRTGEKKGNYKVRKVVVFLKFAQQEAQYVLTSSVLIWLVYKKESDLCKSSSSVFTFNEVVWIILIPVGNVQLWKAIDTR